MRSRSAVAFTCVVALVASAGIGCGSSGDDASTDREPGPALPTADPAALGPYRIGVTTIETTSGDPSPRTIPIEVWYPAIPDASASPEVYALKIGVLTIASLASPFGAVRDAEIDLRGAPHPVVAFSHGNAGTRLQNLYLTEWLASHGFVVAAPDHVGNTLAEQVNQANAVSPAEAARLRPMDVSRTLDALLDHAASRDDLLWLAADPARVGVAGHSFGGFTAFRIAGATMDVAAVEASCASTPDQLFCKGWSDLGGPFPASARDERFRAALPQAPAGASVFGDAGFANVNGPTMIQGGTADQTAPYDQEQVPAYQAVPPVAYLLGIDGAGHFTFSNMCELIAAAPDIGSLAGGVFDDGCGPANVAPADAHAVIDRYATAFFQLSLVGDGSFASLLDPTSPVPAHVASFQAKH